ncbi:hypothetical protein [Microvirga sp. G4-2]|uniref:hypothetical protein n=1 Tax=Microvirga sp. G4-2 TaxID=3434467 RepID=UPI0040444A7A
MVAHQRHFVAMPLGFLILLALLAATPVGATDYYVSTTGNNAQSGSLDAPFRTINYAVGRLKPGDVLFIRGGTYFETVRVTTNGTQEAPITVRSYPNENVTIDSGPSEFREPGNADWEPVNRDLGEFRSVRRFPAGDTPFAYISGIAGYENERVLLVPYKGAEHFRASSDAYMDEAAPIYAGPGVYYDSSDERIHIRLAKTSDLKAAEARYGPVFPSDFPDPRRYSILLSMARVTLEVAGSYLTFKDLTVNQATRTIQISASVHDIRFEGLTVWNGAKGITAEAENVHNVTITRSRIYGDNPYWIFWSDMKNAPFPALLMRVTAIDLHAGAHNWDISYNHIRGSGQDLVSTNTNEDRIFVHHNRLENCGDDAFEIEGSVNVGLVSIHDNYIANCLTALAPGQDTPRFDGPLLFYRNVVSLLRNPPVSRAPGINAWDKGQKFGFLEMFKNSDGTRFMTRNVHIYHNTLLLLGSTGRGVNITPKDPENSRIANNIIMTVNGPTNGRYRLGEGQVVDGNLYWKINPNDGLPLAWNANTIRQLSRIKGIEAHGIGDVPGRGTDPRLAGLNLKIADSASTVWQLEPESEVLTITDFMLCAQSPAIGAGIVIDPIPAFALPDSRSSRDIGAIPFGTPAAEFDVFPFNVRESFRPVPAGATCVPQRL